MTEILPKQTSRAALEQEENNGNRKIYFGNPDHLKNIKKETINFDKLNTNGKIII